MNQKRWIALAIAIGLLVLSTVAQFTTTVATTDFTDMFQSESEYAEEVIEQGSIDERVAVVNVEGVIQSGVTGGVFSGATYNHDRILGMLDHVKESDQFKALVLNVNTPGGGVVESAEIHDRIVDIRGAGKPVYVSMGNTAASGGYYISAPADKIVAHEATLTGSIGVIMESINFAELADSLGVDFNTITSGEYKDIMSSSRPMTEDEEEILQTMVDDMYQDFVDVIVEGRDMDESKVRELGDGRVYTGSQAEENGLVDALGSLDDTIAQMKEEQDLQNAQVVELGASAGFNSIMNGAATSLFGDEMRASKLQEFMRESNSPRAMYLYTE
ncbi:signal peptide peptidase SppA [Alkalibacillus almallahensis]|uniref:signal peptide peptidase SppA n=1 Tax=Alkalibacillus almallahensis TaxID=1379154 RepID=UPI00141F60E3|nr:signal peptide peptidase SppA [Alkalibacillus almallahensis]NIK12982.1 protease-4 [Alkalibacillus almallahensis]